MSLKLKLIENLTGLGNSDAGVIKSIAQSLFKEEHEDLIEVSTITEEDIDHPKFTASNVEDFEDHVVYEVNGEKKIGYKIN